MSQEIQSSHNTIHPLGSTNLSTEKKPQSGPPTSISNVGSVSKLQSEFPDFYDAVIMGLAMRTCKMLQDHAKKLKEIQSEANRA